MPLGDFAGSGYGGRMIKSRYRELKEDGQAISRWVMPYPKTAKITIINKAGFDVGIASSNGNSIYMEQQNNVFSYHFMIWKC